MIFKSLKYVVPLFQNQWNSISWISLIEVYCRKRIRIHFSFQASSEKNAAWIPVQSVAVENESMTEGNRNLELQPKNQSIINKIYVVEKALKIGVPLLFALFTGSFFAVGFYLKKWGKCQMFFLMFLLIMLSNKGSLLCFFAVF